MQTVGSAILIGLAANYLLVAWFHGSITANARGLFDSDWPVISARQRGKPNWYVSVLVFITDLVTCPFCLCIHVCFWLHVLAYATGVPGALSGLIIGPAASACVAVLTYKIAKDMFFATDDDANVGFDVSPAEDESPVAKKIDGQEDPELTV